MAEAIARRGPDPRAGFRAVTVWARTTVVTPDDGVAPNDGFGARLRADAHARQTVGGSALGPDAASRAQSLIDDDLGAGQGAEPGLVAGGQVGLASSHARVAARG